MKRTWTILFLIFSCFSLPAQSICDSVLMIDPIPDLCALSDATLQFSATPPGGVFSGPNVTPEGWLNPSFLTEGTYTVSYTITTDTCAVSTSQNFTILPSPPATAWSDGVIDCTNPGGATVELIGSYSGNGFAHWSDLTGNLISFNSIATTDKAGLYFFVVEDPANYACHTRIPVEVLQLNTPTTEVISCSGCSGIGPIRIGADADDSFPRYWTNLTTGQEQGSTTCRWITQAGLWQVTVQDTSTGCLSRAVQDIPSVEDYVPYVNAGSTTPIPCAGSVGQLLGAYNQSEWEFDVLWTTNDGSLLSDINTLTPYFNAPGTYYLTVTNPFNGCSDTDSVTVAEAILVGTTQDTICAGTTLFGYHTSGTYIDTLTNDLGCDSVRILDLFVWDTTVVTASIIDESGAADGAVVLNVTGEAPFYFEWSTGVEGPAASLSNLAAGTYDVSITSAAGCSTVFPFVIGLDPVNGGATAAVNGKLFFDVNNNCILDAGEQGLANVHLQLGDTPTLAQGSDAQGDYHFPLSPGSYFLTATAPSPLWAACTDTIALPPLNSFDTLTVNYPMQAVVSSPILSVEIAVPALRRCFENTYTVHYKNTGTATATDAYVEVLFDPNLDVISSTNPWAMVDGTRYTFELGDLAINETGSFSIVVIPNCQTTVLGEVLCVEAHIYPDTIPDIVGLNWDGPLITVDGACIDGELNFSIKNIGDGDMLVPKTYIVIEDAILNATDDFQLLSGGEEVVTIPGNGATFWLRAEQAEGAPFDPFPGYAIEGCATDTVLELSLGFMNAFAFSDLGQAVDGECRLVIGSYDPNRKLAFPEGFREEHFLERGVPIEYMIQFQNTGTDTAFTVEIVDVLPEELALGTFEMLASSHAYSYRIEANNELRFRFDNILLPDSTTNEPASHGYVKFKIKPKDNLPAGTKIENEAAIYFDFNEPIITDAVFHTIWEASVFESLVSTTMLKPQVDLRIFPNPFTSSARLVVEGAKGQDFRFVLYDVLGKPVYQKRSRESAFDIRPSGLLPGAYFFELSEGTQVIGKGKLIMK